MSRVLPQDVWACPACQKGWQQYIIATDMNVCSKCGYHGGDPEKWMASLERQSAEAMQDAKGG